jgi:hypothetical protein
MIERKWQSGHPRPELNASSDPEAARSPSWHSLEKRRSLPSPSLLLLQLEDEGLYCCPQPLDTCDQLVAPVCSLLELLHCISIAGAMQLPSIPALMADSCLHIAALCSYLPALRSNALTEHQR